MREEILWAATTGVAVVIVVAYLRFAIRRNTDVLARRTLDEVLKRFAGRRLMACIPEARFHGLRKDWDVQWRRRGVLVLTRDVLYFRPWRNNLDLTIPVDRIIQVETQVDGGKASSKHNNVIVNYLGSDDLVRTASWAMDDPRQLVEGIRALQEGEI